MANETSVADPQYEELFRAGKIAIPLKSQANSSLNPQPNFLVIDNVFDYLMSMWPNAQGELVKTECRNTISYLMYNEILEADKARGKERTTRKCMLDAVGNVPIPLEVEAMIRNHEQLIINEQAINAVLSGFQFRGFLAGFKLELDTLASQTYLDYLEEKEAEEEAKIQAQLAAQNPPVPGPESPEEETV